MVCVCLWGGGKRVGEEGQDREVGEVSIQVTSGKGNIKKYEFVFSTIFLLFLFVELLKQMTRNVTGFLFISEIKNNDQRVSGRIWWCWWWGGGGRGRGLEA